MKTTINHYKVMKKNTELNISQGAVEEYIDRVISETDPNMKMAEEIAKKEGRKTIMRSDIIKLFGKLEVSTAGRWL